jgi:hypothetical protein
MTKLTKAQLKAVSALLADIDELENKPRRLYHALEQFALAFGANHAVPGIRVAQDSIYAHINEGESYQMLFSSLREFKIEEWKRAAGDPTKDGETEDRIQGASDFVGLHIKRMADSRF